MFMNLNGIDYDVVILVRVQPNGEAEKLFMKDFKKIVSDLHIKSHAVQLYALFGWTHPNGNPYNQYELDFRTKEDLMNALTWLGDYFREMVIEHEEVYEESSPEVVFARRIPD